MNLRFYRFFLYLLLPMFIFACSSPQQAKLKEPERKIIKTRKKTIKKINKASRLDFTKSKIKIKVFIFDFFNKSPHGEERLGIEIAKSYRKRLSTSNNILLIWPDEISSLKGKRVSEIDIEDTIKVLKANDIRIFAYGSIDYFSLNSEQEKVGVFRDEIVEMDIKFNLRFVEISSGKVIYEKDIRVQDEAKRTVVWKGSEKSLYDESFTISVIDNALKKTISPVERVVLRLSWEGRLAKVTGNRVYINAGKKSGVEIGDLLKIIEQGEEIIDPQSGRLLGFTEGRIKGTAEVKGYFGDDGSIAEIYTGGGFLEGDKVELY